MTLKISRTLDEKENQNIDLVDLLDYMDKNLTYIRRCHTPTSCMLLLFYLTFALIIKCPLQNPATNNNLEITKTELSEVSDQILLTAHSWRQLQPGNWKILLKLASEELTGPKSALEEIINLPHSENAHFLTRHIVKKPIHICQSSVSDDRKVSPRRIKTNYK